MGFIDDIALPGTRDIIDALSDDGITLYPVRAAEVAAYPGSAVDLSGLAVMEGRAVEIEDGVIEIDAQQLALITDTTTASDNGIVQGCACSVLYNSVLYDIVRVIDDGLSQITCWLRKYQ